jgi:hypothetical protein
MERLHQLCQWEHPEFGYQLSTTLQYYSPQAVTPLDSQGSVTALLNE